MNISHLNKHIFILIAIPFLLSGCSAYRMRVANDFYEQNAFADAIPVYKKVLSKQKNAKAMIKLADCLRQTNNPQESEIWYKKIMNIREQRPIDKLFYAQVLMINGKYSEAKQWLEIYSHYSRSDDRLLKLMESCDSLSQFYKDTSRYQIEMLKINSTGTSNFGPSFYRSGIVFSSDRDNAEGNNKRNNWNGRNYTDIYYSKKTEMGHWLDPERLRGEVNGSYNDGPASFNKDNTVMYLTRNSYIGTVGELSANKKDFNVLKIFKSTLVGNEWKIGNEMPFCSDEYSVGHATINKSGTAIYFTSDMPWGYGGTDLYIVKWVNARWSKPQNLGATINSSGNEMFPFIQNDSVLYFSSDGNYGMGGLDIYQSTFDGSVWTEPVNVGYPINSSFDDFGFIIDSIEKTGFFSSNRFSGVDKIFSFEKGLPVLSVSGTLYETGTSRPINGARISLETKGNKDTSLVTDNSGKYFFPLQMNRNYVLTAFQKDYYFKSLEFSTFGKRESEGFVQNITMDRLVLNKAVIWREIQFNKKGIELTQSSYPVLDQLADILKHNSEIEIEFASYTDSRGNDQENIILTQKRAEVCINYLLSKGIVSSRIKGKGYGETRLLNNCSNGILCLDEEHAENNRIEIKVTTNQK